jgi:hypothetical protein
MRFPLTQLLFPLTLLLFALARPVAAQVGHAPDASPFRDLSAGHSITPLVGYVGGSGGPLGVGPHNGTTIGLRYDLRTASTIQFGVGFARGNLERLVVNPFVQLANRVSGPFEQPTSFLDLSVQFNLTGGKSWHRLAPYASLGAGLAFGDSDVASDSSGYEFGNKFYVTPAIGTRLMLTDALHLRADVRGLFWSLKYPDSYAREPVEEPGTSDAPNAVKPQGSLSEWTLTPMLQVGLGYIIHW